MPSGTPIPTPIAVGRLVEGACVWAGTGGPLGTGEPVEVMAEEEAVTVVAFELGPTEKIVVTGLLGLLV